MNVEVAIDRLNNKGWGIGSFNQATVEVFGGLPGDRLLAVLNKKRKGKYRAHLLEIIQPSAMRIKPRCTHVSLCGGCSLQQMDYAAQLQEKEKKIRALFAPFAKSDAIKPIVPCTNPWEYRNKMEFSFSSNRAGEKFLGLMIAGSKGYVLNLTECHLVSSWVAPLLHNVRMWWEQSGLSAYRMNNTGTLRTLIVREAKRTQDKMVMLTVSGNPAYPIKKQQLHGFTEAVKNSFPANEHPHLSLFLRVQQIHKGSPTQFFEMHLGGPDHIVEQIQLEQGRSLKFKISPTAFFQPNTVQAEKLYSLARGMVDSPKKHILDLYAGGATLGIVMADQAEKVSAIELNPHSCFDAKVNCALNHISNLEILCGDVAEQLQVLKNREDFEMPDLIVVDPPRTGLDARALQHLKELKSKEILYISCNPMTQVDNVAELAASGYTATQIQPVDQFPHTPHVENIVLLRYT